MNKKSYDFCLTMTLVKNLRKNNNIIKKPQKRKKKTKKVSPLFNESASLTILNFAESFVWTFIFVNSVKRAES